MRLLRTDFGNPDFIKLVNALDAELAERDGEDHSFYAQFNKIEHIKHVVLAYVNEIPLGCGAIKQLDPHTMEVKRMYVAPKWRGTGIAIEILKELENWTKELSFDRCILETGKRQIEAIEFYKKAGYSLIPNYGQYVHDENSLCFEKRFP